MVKRMPQTSTGRFEDPESTMSAVEDVVGAVFEQASNDEIYHKPISSVKEKLHDGTCVYEPDEIAERILAWSLDL